MKVFKLIKEYPGSPKLNTIVDLERSVNNDGVNYYLKGQFIKPEDYPEYWEEVVEKDYEILVYERFNRLFHYTEKPRLIGFEGARHYQDLNVDFGGVIDDVTMVNLEPVPKIHSVKRLSDGEVFTVGDNTNIGIIGSFDYPNGNNLYIRPKNKLNTGAHLINAYKQIEHVKQPLFTTEDGVDIYEGDTIYRVSNSIGVIFKEPCEIYTSNWNWYEKNYNVKGQHPNHKHFSTKEAAEEYIMLNKKQFSYLDIEKHLTKKGKTYLLNNLNNPE